MSTDTAATLVFPTRHEEDNVGPLLQALHSATADLGRFLEVLFVDDSDNMRTVAAICEARRVLDSYIFGSHLVIRYVHRPKGQRPGGLSGAMATGLREAKSDLVIFQDGDGQHPPQVVPALLREINDGHDVVVGSRYREGGSNEGLDGLFRRFVSRAATAVTKLLFPRALRGVTDPMSGCFAVRRNEVDIDRLDPRGFKFLLDLLARHPRLRRTEVPLQFRARAAGGSKAGEGNGREFLKQLPILRVRTLPTWLNFAMVGGLVALYGVALLWVLVHAGLDPRVANPIQLAATLLLNFALNSKVTWPKQTKGHVKWQFPAFVAVRVAIMMASWYVFVVLYGHGVHYQLANIIGVGLGAILSYPATKPILDHNSRRRVNRVFADRSRGAGASHASRERRNIPWRLALVLILVASAVGAGIMSIGWRGTMMWSIIAYALFCFATSSMEASWRLYGRRNPEAIESMRFPQPVLPTRARIKFSLIVPARHEQQVLRHTLLRLTEQTHPWVEIVVSLRHDDPETIAEAQAAAAQSRRIRLVVHDYTAAESDEETLPTAKPDQLNVAFATCTDADYVGVFDAEDDVSPQLMLHIEALINGTGADVVQGGVQLVNLDLRKPSEWDRLRGWPRLRRVLRPFFTSRLWTNLRAWYCVHNVLEYAFWFSSRMFFQITQRFVPLGGNTSFIRANWLREHGGWPTDRTKLTEDCAVGVDASVQGLKFVAAYQPDLATQEETPSRLFGSGGWFRQRVRWNQGFLSVLLKGEWLKLSLRQRLMAMYILGMPFVQAMNAVVLPICILAIFVLRAPVVLVLVMYLPFIPIMMTLVLQLIGLREFSRNFNRKLRLRHYSSLVFMNYPYQLLQAAAAVTASVRLLRGRNNWFLTAHLGEHVDNPSLPGMTPVTSSVKGSVA